MSGPKWDISTQPCPQCNQTGLVYDGSVKWRNGPRANFDIVHYLHCVRCSARYYDSVDGRHPRLNIDKDEEGTSHLSKAVWLPGSIGDNSARIGYDVRDLKMAGYSDTEINKVLYGQRTLEDLLDSKPGQHRV